jgi:hypothetical protein
LRTSNGFDRRRVAVVVTSDGRRVQVPIEDDSFEVVLLSLIRSLLVGIERLVGLITVGRREDRGTRRDGRS